MTALISIFLVYTLLVLFFFKKPGYLLSYIILFTSLNNIILEQVGAIEFRFFVGVLFLFLYFIVYFKPRLFKRNMSEAVVNKLFWGVLLIPLLMFTYIFLVGGVSESGIQYSIHFVTSTIFYFFAVLILIQNNNIYNQFVDSIIIWGSIYYIAVFLFIDFSVIDISDRSTLAETDMFNAITLGRISGILFIVGLIQIAYTKSKIIKILSIVVVIISIYWILVASTRQIVIGLLLVISFYSIMKFNLNKTSIASIIILLIITILSISYVDITQFSMIERFRDLENIETHERYYDYILTYSIFQDYTLFGIGQHGYQDIWNRYPHSFFLEMVASFGLFGIVSFSLITIYGFKYSIFVINKNHFNHRYDIISLLWMFYYVSVMISGDLNINRQFWILTGMLIVTVLLIRKSNSNN